MELITFQIYETTFTDPMGFLTNLILAILCFYFVFRLKSMELTDPVNKAYLWFYFFLGFSSLSAGLGHLLVLQLPINFFKYGSWLLSGFEIYFLEKGTLRKFASKSQYKMLLPIITIQLMLFFGSVFYFLNFNTVIVNSVIGLIFVVKIGHIIDYVKNKSVGSGLIALGFLVTLFSVFFRLGQISFHQWFNYNDIGHLFMAIGISIMFIGNLKLHSDNLNAA